MEQNTYVIDIQGFRRSRNLFVLKELAFAAVGKATQGSVIIFKPPCKWSHLLESEQKTNRYLVDNFHGIEWEYGWAEFTDIVKVLQESLKDAHKIMVKGLEKKRWLQELLPGK